jgi:ankyrin repeat protein
LEVLRLCLEAGASFTGAVAAAVLHHRHEIADWLLRLDPRQKCEIVIAAARSNNVYMLMRYLRELSPADLDHPDALGAPAIVHAATLGYIEIVRLLLAGGADINRARNGGLTALAAAISENRDEIVMALLNHQSVNLAVEFDGRTPLMLAVIRMKNHDLIVDIARRAPHLIIAARPHDVCPLQHAVVAFQDSSLFERLLEMVDPAFNLSQLNTPTFRQYCSRHGRENLIMKAHARRTGQAWPPDGAMDGEWF